MYKNFIPNLIVAFLLLFSISCSVSKIKETAAPEVPAAPKPGDCASCHEDKDVLPQDHVDTRDMTGEKCVMCHKPAGSMSLWSKIPLSHLHQLNGITCEGCHEDPAAPEPAGTAVCQKCHDDVKSLVQAASELELNPHFSPHEGKILDCNKCHNMHKSSKNACAQCHGVKYKVP